MRSTRRSRPFGPASCPGREAVSACGATGSTVTLPSAARLRSSRLDVQPRNRPSTAAATSGWTANRLRSRISTSTSKVGGALRSCTVFCVRRRRASSSPSVTACTPPTTSASVGFSTRFSSVPPCAVAISRTPRSAIVRAAAASASVPISSTTITSGMWFSTASIMVRCWRSGEGTCMRRARPMAACGMSPSPAISFEVSTITTRLPSSSASTRAASRSSVVLPTPGGPSNRRLLSGSWTRSCTMSTVPKTARPTRQVSPMMPPVRFRKAEMRCRVRGMPARLSWLNDPMRSTTKVIVRASVGSRHSVALLAG